tara:strand:+ start:2466 stop:2678 length:213 start_codon:yes stop_codon:yes gene_type:complete
MEYAEFMKITDRWSDNDTVCFLMEYPLWNKLIIRFIANIWHDGVIEAEHIEGYANDNNIMEHTDLPEVEE